MALLGIPYQYGEVRWLAAHALAAERRAAAGRAEPVVVADIPVPLGVEALAALAAEAGLPDGAGHEGLLAWFAELREQHRLPLITLEI